MSKHAGSISSQAALSINNRYVVADLEKDKLGEGGIGVVYRAMDEQENRFVAIKILHSLITHDPWIKDKFDKEAQAIIRIKHEGVVTGIEAGKLDDGRPYLVMEYIEGQSLRKPIEQSSNGMDLARSANIIKKFGQALT
ncbi:MAG: serine/threonine protein kinase, partial [bacterium]